MSRCYICDTYIETPEIDSRDGRIKPCTECEHWVDEASREGTDDDFIAFLDDFDEDPSSL